MSRRALLIAAAAAAALVVAAAGIGGYAYFFGNLRQAPAALSLATPSATTSATPAAATGASVAGTWTVAKGSGTAAGYRVTEQFAGQSSPHEAVARTGDVSGGFTVGGSGNSLVATGVNITVALTGLVSQDTVAGYNVANRDRIVQNALATGRFPTATFTADSIPLTGIGASGGSFSSTAVPGTLTIHGVSKPVVLKVDARGDASGFTAAGSAQFQMTDFGVQPPSIGFTSVNPATTIEFQLALAKQ